MSLEHLAFRYTFLIPDFPKRWFPLVQLYDADIPLFPLQYFHAVPSEITSIRPPAINERVFGYIERINLTAEGLETTVLCNKDVQLEANLNYRLIIENEVRERLGVNNPINKRNIDGTFYNQLASRNLLLSALWTRVVTKYFDDTLPFGKLLDKVYGLIRFVSSFYSPAGRKSELIETHYFCSKFGEEITSIPALPQMTFYLLPTFEELTNNWLTHFRKFNDLSVAVDDFHARYCAVENIGRGLTFTRFLNPDGGQLNSEKILKLINSLSQSSRYPLTETFNAFDKGPTRTMMFLTMFSDIKSKRLDPSKLVSQDFALIYKGVKGFYQTPKVISLYSQQCFGNESALPIDTWISTFLDCPFETEALGVKPLDVFSYSTILGKTERLLWYAAQARKIHSPICNDAIWCIKYDSERSARGANPLSCGACKNEIRSQCPAFSRIKNQSISFNEPRGLNCFEIWTDGRNNTYANQKIRKCEGKGFTGTITDDFTSIDSPNSFKLYPAPNHINGVYLSVNDFIEKYCV